MRGGGLIWFLAAIAIGLFGTWYFWHGGVASLFLVLLSAFIMVQGAVTLWFGPKRFKVIRTCHPEHPVAGDKVAVTLTVSFSGGMAPIWLYVEDELALSAAGVLLINRSGDQVGKISFFGQRKEYSGTYYIEEVSRGIYKDKEVRLTWGDSFGWFRRTQYVKTEGVMVVYPFPLNTFPPALDGQGSVEGEAGTMPHRSHMNASPAPGRLRKYEAGDPLRQIHWKYSAKQGTLLTRIAEELGNFPRLLLLSTHVGDYADGASVVGRTELLSSENFELAVSAAASWLQRETLRLGESYFSHSGMDRMVSLYGEQNFSNILEVLAELDLSSSLSAADMLKREWAGLSAGGSCLTLITGQLTADLSSIVPPLVEAGGSLDIWCTCEPHPNESNRKLEAWLRERGVAIVYLSSSTAMHRSKEGAGYVIA
ncbi:DUF58 domain-containing protein [Paenibacillus puldeungensis]|uniref:DUF58 domain-containing protein n=1 Tax=Paenibacillus puldeungensis TaxID=696536 RepID=A0ABW3RY49_9BACL